jgi:hypothetical protein
MAENLLYLLNTVIGNLPESELRTVRDAVQNSLRVADDQLLNHSISSTFDMLSVGEGEAESECVLRLSILLIYPKTVSTALCEGSSVSTASSSYAPAQKYTTTFVSLKYSLHPL